MVPADIDNPQTRHLRDIEIAALLKRMLDKKLIVTLVIDSCHSGGLTRGKGGATVRGSDVEDKTPRPQDSLIASIDELELIWKGLSSSGAATTAATKTTTAATTRGFSASGWLPQPKGYVLLASMQAFRICL